MNIKKRFIDFMLKPANNIQSSQTLYEALLATLNMFIATKEEMWEKEAKHIAQMIVKSQLQDGGFDIGYNFRFGEQLKKTTEIQATTPECLSIFALIEYYKILKDVTVKNCIEKGMLWIKKQACVNENGYWVIPYAPDTLKKVHITNAISFCVATIANYMVVFEDYSYLTMYQSMCEYMLSQLTVTGNGGFWYYFEKESLEKGEFYSRVDNYHIAQQLYYHMRANELIFSEAAQQIIQNVSNYLFTLLKQDIVVPYIYINDEISSNAAIDVWGYCTLLMCTTKCNDMEISKKLVKILLEKSWNGEYFAPVLNDKLEVIDSRFYPRSDAWVVHALSEYYILNRDSEVAEILWKSLNRLHNCNYKGTENHALTLKKEALAVLAKIYHSVKKEKHSS